MLIYLCVWDGEWLELHLEWMEVNTKLEYSWQSGNSLMIGTITNLISSLCDGFILHHYMYTQVCQSHSHAGLIWRQVVSHSMCDSSVNVNVPHWCTSLTAIPVLSPSLCDGSVLHRHVNAPVYQSKTVIDSSDHAPFLLGLESSCSDLKQWPTDLQQF